MLCVENYWNHISDLEHMDGIPQSTIWYFRYLNESWMNLASKQPWLSPEQVFLIDIPSKSDLNSSLSLIESQQGSISLGFIQISQVKAETKSTYNSENSGEKSL